jgi:hypothetical protein
MAPARFFRRAIANDAATSFALFWAEIDNPVGTFDDFQIVLDNHECVVSIAKLDQTSSSL